MGRSLGDVVDGGDPDVAAEEGAAVSEIQSNKRAAGTSGRAEAGEERTASGLPSTVSGHPIEVILARQLAGYLALGVIMIDPSWSVIYYNEPAEHILGRRFDEAGPIPWTSWSNVFHFTDTAGQPLSAEEIPLLASLRSRRTSHLVFHLRGLDGITRRVDMTGIPLAGNAGRFLGTIGIVEEIER